LAESAFTRKSRDYLAKIDVDLQSQSAQSIAARVVDLVRQHEDWRGRVCLNMNPAEGLISPLGRQLLASDMATRVTEGFPGDKIFPHHQQNQFIDEIEAIVISLARRQFGAKFVEWRPVSTSMANAVVFSALLAQDDVILSQSLDAGGNYSYQTCGPAGLRSGNIVPIPARGKTFEIDVDVVAELAERVRPKMIVIGGSKVLFPYPVRELRRIADQVGAILLFDAAHVGLFIASGTFQRPLQEGCQVVTVGTHKVLGGPVGGLVLTNDEEIASRVTRLTFPALLQTRDQNKMAALAVTLAELERFGPELARRTVVNAQALARELAAGGFEVIGRDGRYTETQQVIVELGSEAQAFERRCNEANILVPDCALTGDAALGRRSGARLGAHELTRLGMGPDEMVQVAALIRDAARDGAQASEVAENVRVLRSRFINSPFTFADVPTTFKCNPAGGASGAEHDPGPVC
jgi:glycine hydroxymethyltransferase